MSGSDAPSTWLAGWAPEAALAVLVLALGVGEAVNTRLYDGEGGRPALLLVAVASAVIVASARRYPGAALTGVWAMGLLHGLSDVQVLLVELAFVVVAFATARWGRPLTLFLSGVSIPVAAGVAVALVYARGYNVFLSLPFGSSLFQPLLNLGDGYVLGAGALGVAVLGVPWLAGLSFRFADTARASRASQEVAEDAASRAIRESEQAREIARLRDGQARLARDVHDVVGHSLAVILAQAESAQYLDDVDTSRLKATMATIATSARSSLHDVRHVLQAGESGAGASSVEPPRPLDTLVDGVRASGHEVVGAEIGTPQPLPPELEVVAYRVLQEMLTNAIRHGRRDEPVFVERHWPDGALTGELRIEVRNVSARPRGEQASGDDRGQGLAGMRRRLESVGGRLDVRRREEASGTTFTTTAWVPVRTVAT